MANKADAWERVLAGLWPSVADVALGTCRVLGRKVLR